MNLSDSKSGTQQTESNSQNQARKNSTPESSLLVLEHRFDVPVAKLFSAFKTPDAVKAWWWPNGLHTDRVDLEFKEGGRYFINMKGFEQGGGGMVGTFEEITENRRIVMDDQFADENGKVITAKEADMTGNWPETVYITFDFESTGANSSRVTLSQQGIPNELQKDCKQGWTEMFTKLESYLNGRKQ